MTTQEQLHEMAREIEDVIVVTTSGEGKERLYSAKAMAHPGNVHTFEHRANAVIAMAKDLLFFEGVDHERVLVVEIGPRDRIVRIFIPGFCPHIQVKASSLVHVWLAKCRIDLGIENRRLNENQEALYKLTSKGIIRNRN